MQTLKQTMQNDDRWITNVGKWERVASLALGAAFVLHALMRRSWSSLITGPLGLLLITRGQTGHSVGYHILGVSTADSAPAIQDGARPRAGIRGNEIEIHKTVTVNQSAQANYDFWRDFENFPRFMHHIQSVRRIDEGVYHWVANVATDTQVEWTARVTADVPGEHVAWQTLPDAPVQQIGSVEFKPARGDRGTAVTVHIQYSPPGGVAGEAFARLLNGVTAQQVKEDVRRFKEMMEAGEVATTAGQPSGPR